MECILDMSAAKVVCVTKPIPDTTDFITTFNVVTFPDSFLAYDVVLRVGGTFKAKMFLMDSKDEIINLGMFNLNKLADICQERKLTVILEWKDNDETHKVLLNPDEPDEFGLITSLSATEDFKKALPDIATSVIVKRCHDSFVKVVNVEFDNSKVEDDNDVLFGMSWLMMLQQAEDVHELLDFIHVDNYPEEFLMDEVIANLMKDMDELCEKRGLVEEV